MTDARTLNWRFVVPDEPDGLEAAPAGVPLACFGEAMR